MVMRGLAVGRVASSILLCTGLGIATACDAFPDWHRIEVVNRCDASVRVVATGAESPSTWSTDKWLLLEQDEQGVAGVVPDGEDPIVRLWVALDDGRDAEPVFWSDNILEDEVRSGRDGGPVASFDIPRSVCKELQALP